MGYKWILTGAAVLISFLGVDMVWLGWLARDFYRQHLGVYMGPVRWSAAVVFYILYIAGLLVFVVNPLVGEGNWMRVLGMGILFGVVAYGTYELTNMAVMKQWSWTLVVVDMVWGGVLTGMVAVVGWYVARRVGI